MTERRFRCKRCGSLAEWMSSKGGGWRELVCVNLLCGERPDVGVCEVCGDVPVRYYPVLADPVCPTCKLR